MRKHKITAMRVHGLGSVIGIGIASSKLDLSRRCSSQTLGAPREHSATTWLKSLVDYKCVKDDAEICQVGCIAGTRVIYPNWDARASICSAHATMQSMHTQ